MDAKRFSEIAQRVALEDARMSVLGARKPDPARWPKLKFPVFSTSDSRFAVSPDCSYRLLAQALSQTKHELLIYIYNVTSEALLELVGAVRDKGVKIRMMVDYTDTRGDEMTKLKALKLGADLRAAPSIGDRQVFSVCHQKFIVIDGRTTIVESANWASSSIPVLEQPGAYKRANREWLARIDDPKLAAWFKALFEADWNIPAAAGVQAMAEIPAVPTMNAEARAEPPPQVFDIRHAAAAASVTPVVSPDNYLAAVTKLLAGAQKSIDVQQQYILAGDGVKELLEVIEERKATGCRVRLMSSAAFAENWQNTIDTVATVGLDADLKAVNPKWITHCHNKGVIVDGRWAVVSSTNWSENSILRAREAGLLIDSAEIAAYFTQVFDLDWKEGLSAKQAAEALVALPAAEFA